MLHYYSQPSTRLDHRAEIWRMVESDTKDDTGQYPVAPARIAKVWAGVTPQTGSLLNGRPAETVLARTTHKIIIRYRSDLEPDMWFEVDGEKYDILYILDPYLKHETLECFCEVRFDG